MVFHFLANWSFTTIFRYTFLSFSTLHLPNNHLYIYMKGQCLKCSSCPGFVYTFVVYWCNFTETVRYLTVITLTCTFSCLVNNERQSVDPMTTITIIRHFQKICKKRLSFIIKIKNNTSIQENNCQKDQKRPIWNTNKQNYKKTCIIHSTLQTQQKLICWATKHIKEDNTRQPPKQLQFLGNTERHSCVLNNPMDIQKQIT